MSSSTSNFETKNISDIFDRLSQSDAQKLIEIYKQYTQPKNDKSFVSNTNKYDFTTLENPRIFLLRTSSVLGKIAVTRMAGGLLLNFNKFDCKWTVPTTGRELPDPIDAEIIKKDKEKNGENSCFKVIAEECRIQGEDVSSTSVYACKYMDILTVTKAQRLLVQLKDILKKIELNLSVVENKYFDNKSKWINAKDIAVIKKSIESDLKIIEPLINASSLYTYFEFSPVIIPAVKPAAPLTPIDALQKIALLLNDAQQYAESFDDKENEEILLENLLVHFFNQFFIGRMPSHFYSYQTPRPFWARPRVLTDEVEIKTMKEEQAKYSNDIILNSNTSTRYDDEEKKWKAFFSHPFFANQIKVKFLRQLDIYNHFAIIVSKDFARNIAYRYFARTNFDGNQHRIKFLQFLIEKILLPLKNCSIKNDLSPIN